MMQKNTITVTSDKITQPLTFAFAADFHNGDADEALALMQDCDAILIGGDLVNRHSRHGWRNAARFLDLAPRVAPTFYNLGNHERLQPDHVSVEDGLALIAVVGQGMIYAKGTAARIFRVIADANINIRMIDQGSSELNIIIAVKETDYELAIRSLYHAVERVL